MTDVVLELRGVHARDGAGIDGKPRGALVGASLTLGAGVHAVVGAPADGALALIDAVTGATRVTKGRVTVRGEDPWRSARARSRIGSLVATPRLPEHASVRGAVGLVCRARGQVVSEVEAMAETLGIGALLPRRPSTLSFGEERAVELAIALATPSADLLVLHEPLGDVGAAASGAAGLLASRLGEIAERGAAVVVVTSSWADARELASHHVVLERGVVTRDTRDTARSDEARPLVLRAWVRGEAEARELAAALLREAHVRGVSFLAPPPGDEAADAIILDVQGDAVESCSLALLDAAAAAGCDVLALRDITDAHHRSFPARSDA